jgi:hypothetical protein
MKNRVNCLWLQADVHKVNVGVKPVIEGVAKQAMKFQQFQKKCKENSLSYY